MLKRIRPILASAVVALAATPSAVSADTVSTTVIARLQVDTSCRLFTEPLAFGTVALPNITADATAAIRLSCGPSVAYSVAIDNGLHFNGSRRMWAGSGNIYTPYQIYRDAARTQLWGTGANQVTGTTPLDGEVTLVAYGRVPDTRRPARPYTDRVTVTVNF